MTTHAQGVRLTTPARRGRPKTVRDGVATSVYLPMRYVVMIEAYRKANGLRSASEAHREIIERWAATVREGGGA